MRLPSNRGALLQPQVAGGELDLEAPDVLEPTEDLGGGVLSPGRVGEMGVLARGDEIVEGFDDGSEEGEEEGVAIVVVGIGRGDDTVNSEEERVGLGNQGIEPLGDGAAADEGFDVGDFAEDVEDNRVGYGVEPVGLVESISRMLHINLHFWGRETFCCDFSSLFFF